MSDKIPLIDLEPHTCGIVSEIDAKDDEMARLMAMGVCTGRMVELIQIGNPLILRVYGTRIGVSKRLAERIHVVPSTPCCEKEITP